MYFFYLQTSKVKTLSVKRFNAYNYVLLSTQKNVWAEKPHKFNFFLSIYHIPKAVNYIKLSWFSWCMTRAWVQASNVQTKLEQNMCICAFASSVLSLCKNCCADKDSSFHFFLWKIVFDSTAGSFNILSINRTFL